MNWTDLYERARARTDAAFGSGDRNVRVEAGEGPVIVRIPVRGADIADLRLWREEEVLAAIAPYVRDAPRVLHTSEDPPFQVHEFVDGTLLDDLAPRGAPVPRHVPDDVAELFVRLSRVAREKLPPTPPGWPADGDTRAFARRLSDLTRRVAETCRTDHPELYERFGFPGDPLAPVEKAWDGLSRRAFGCVHADVHRRNVIIDGGASRFLDWELALWGDPVYELAAHLHKMEYLPRERDRLLSRWTAEMAAGHAAGWERDLPVYLAHERVKSALVDAVRFARGGPHREPPERLVAAVDAAWEVWG